jgi:hypothetical protein
MRFDSLPQKADERLSLALTKLDGGGRSGFLDLHVDGDRAGLAKRRLGRGGPRALEQISIERRRAEVPVRVLIQRAGLLLLTDWLRHARDG